MSNGKYTNTLDMDNVRRKMKKPYVIHNFEETLKFDFSWEVYVWIYCIMNGIPIIRNPLPEGIQYEWFGGLYRYYPDFMINGELVEIKGDQFFTNPSDPYNSDMINPHDPTNLNTKMNAKHKLAMSIKVKYLTEINLRKIFSWVRSVFGTRFIRLFKQWNFDQYPDERFTVRRIPGVNPFNIDEHRTVEDSSSKYVFASDKGISPYDL